MWKRTTPGILSLLLEGLIVIGCVRSACLAQGHFPTEFTLNATIRRDLSAGDRHSYEIALDTGTYLRAVVDQSGMYVRAAVYEPRGKKLNEVDCREDGPTAISIIAQTSGTYRLEIRSLERERAHGTYEATIVEIRQAATQDRNRIAAEILFAEGDRQKANLDQASLTKAIEKYQEALALWRALDDKAAEVSALRAIGELHHLRGELKKALEYVNRALLLAQEIKDPRLEGETLDVVGGLQLDLGENQKALEYCTRALALSKHVNNSRGEAKALNSVGEVYYAFGNRQEALQYYRQGLALWRSLRDRRGQAQALYCIGSVYSDLSDTQKALDSYDNALSLWQEAHDQRGRTLTLEALADVYSRSGKTQKALDLYDQAIQLVRVIGDSITEARILSGMAYVYKELGEEEKTLEYYRRALSVYRAAGYKRWEVVSLAVIGIVYQSRQDHHRALIEFQEALSAISSMNDKALESFVLKNIAAVYGSLGDREKALNCYGRALELCRTLGDHRGEAYVLNGIGDIYSSVGEKEKALDYQDKALVLNRLAEDPFGEVSTLSSIAKIRRDLGTLAEARATVEDAISKIESLRVDVASRELRASFIATVRQNYELYIDLLMRLHKPGTEDGLDANALHASERARARSLLEMLAEARADIRQDVDAALLDRERTLQQSLTDKEERYSLLLTGKHTDEQARAAASDIASITTEYQQVQGQIRFISPRYAALAQPKPLSLKEIQQQVLDSDTLLLEYALGDERSYLWAVTTDSLTSFELPKRAEIEAAARRYYDLLVAPNPSKTGETARQARRGEAESNYSKAASDLSRMLLGAVASQLGTKRILVVADGALQYIPFGALPVAGGPQSAAEAAGGNAATRADGSQPLIVDHEIISLPSASTLAVLRRELANRKPAPRAVAVFADPVFSIADPRLNSANTRRAQHSDGESFSRDFERAIKQSGVSRTVTNIPRLPFSRREADSIKGSVPAGEAMEAVDFDASRARAISGELSQYRIVHFATHGLLNSAHPELSGIVLSLVDRQGKPQNGFLRLHEVYNLNLPAELVVLSACQTGLGKEVKGEGLIGLTRGFMYAGAARVMASLWKVDDAATAELMKQFYTRMLAGGLSPAAALREAQVEMLKQKRWQAPYSWAGFVLQGEWK